jgi:acetyl-CoA acetyltransferase
MQSVFVAGAGITPFGKFRDATLRSLGRTAALAALKDGAVAPSDIEMIACGSARSGMAQRRESGVAQLIGWELGINEVPAYNLKAYCASGSTALNVAYMAIAGGFHDIALVVGVEKMSGRAKGQTLTSDGMEAEGDLGFTPPAFFAASAKRHMAEYGTTREQLALVAVKNRAAAVHNPVAQYRTPITVEDVINSRPLAEPLHLFDACPTGDGAAAVVLMSEAAMRRFGHWERRVRVAASVVRTGLYEQVKDLTTYQLDVRTGQQAYAAAGIGPADVDLAEVHDAFTITEIIHCEDLGFCEKGKGGLAVEAGEFGLGGRLPVSTSGGLLTKGHPLGATGIAQVVELTQQLRGESGARQVPDAKVGLAHLNGGFMEHDLATSTVTILSR